MPRGGNRCLLRHRGSGRQRRGSGGLSADRSPPPLAAHRPPLAGAATGIRDLPASDTTPYFAQYANSLMGACQRAQLTATLKAIKARLGQRCAVGGLGAAFCSPPSFGITC